MALGWFQTLKQVFDYLDQFLSPSVQTQRHKRANSKNGYKKKKKKKHTIPTRALNHGCHSKGLHILSPTVETLETNVAVRQYDSKCVKETFVMTEVVVLGN